MIRTVHYVGGDIIHNGYALAVEDRDVAFCMMTADAVDLDRIGIGIVTGAPESGIQGSGNPQSPVPVTVYMARLAKQETDEDIADLLRVVNPHEVYRRVRSVVRDAVKKGQRRNQLVIVMRPKAVLAVKAWCLAQQSEQDGEEYTELDDLGGVTICNVPIVPGETEPGYLFHVVRRLE